MPSVEKILIVGGGIAGLCTAVGLKDSGIETEIVELNPKWDVYGVGIIQLANALRALAALGLAKEAIAEGFPMSSLVMWRPDGEPIATLPQPQIAGPDFPPQNGIARPKLHSILQKAAQAAGTRVRLGLTVAHLETTPHSVKVSFTDGSHGEYDLVVGADGLRSKVRRLAFPSAPEPQYEGQVVWRYNLPRPAEVDNIWMWMGDPKVGIVPLGPNLMYMFITDAAPGSPPRFPEAALAQEMQKRLDSYRHIPLLAQLRAQITDPSKVVLRPFETILVPAPWNQGRVVLIGDAAHAMTAHIAQGAAMAIEDAVVLTEELRRQTRLEVALQAYNHRRFDRVRQMVEMSRQLCIWERTHDPKADPVGVTMASVQLAAQPI
ncbi:MAG: FAD-dependent oxidoreductase [Meiothermus ruber]|uniref:FAD-dependent oxidoreductase n=1 Tax=Meiothermus ruber TaxID=277 RepID=UPI0039194A03